MKSNERIASTLIQLFQGETIHAQKIIDDYNISERTFQRDMETIREKLKESTLNKELFSDYPIKQYSLKSNNGLSFGHVLFLLKLIIGTRVLNKEELDLIIDLLLERQSDEEREVVYKLIRDSLNSYIPLTHGQSILKKIEIIAEFIHKKETIDFSYMNTSTELIKENYGLPVSIYFSESYFYVIIFNEKHEKYLTYRLDRFEEINKSVNHHVKVKYANRLSEGEFQNKTHLLAAGKEVTFKFKYKGFPDTALDKLPKSKIVKVEENGDVIIEACAFSQGALIWLLGQGSLVEIISPKSLKDQMKKELEKTLALYQK